MIASLATELLTESWRDARAAWPSVELEEKAFVAHLARHLPIGVPPVDGLRRLSTADLYLACACAMGNPQALAIFESHCLSVVPRVLARLHVGADMAAEVKQRIRCHVLVAEDGAPRIAAFQGRGSLRAWVRVLAARGALRLLASNRREIPVDELEKLQGFVTPDGPELESMKTEYREIFQAEFDRALRALRARDQTILRLHVLDGLTIDELGALYHVHRTTAARSLERVRRTVLAETRARMRQRLDVDSTELDSILRVIRSRLEITLRGLMGRRRRR